MPRSRLSRIGATLKEEFLHVLYPTIYFFIAFNLLALSARLILAEYLVHLTNFLLATTSALVVGKAVLVADKMPFIRRFDTAPLIQPILFKTFVYWAFVFIARLLEANIEYLIAHGTLDGFGAYLRGQFSWHRFAFIQLWMLVLFLVYVAAAEFNTLFGEGRIRRLLFTQGSTERKLSRRQRIRTLARFDELTTGHSAAEIADPATKVHRECVRVVTELTAPGLRRDTAA